MRKICSLMLGSVCLGGQFVGVGTASAFQRPVRERLPNLDARRSQFALSNAVPAGRVAAANRVRDRVPGAQVDFDGVTGSPKWVGSTSGFLTGPDGRGLLPAALAAVPAADPYRTTKAFIQQNKALFGHGAEALMEARITREYVTPHNGLRTVVWEQQVNGIAVFEGVLISHTTVRGELVNICSQFVPDPIKAAAQGTPGRTALAAPPDISARQAVTLAARNVGEELNEQSLNAIGKTMEGVEQRQKFTGRGLKGDAQVKLTWLPMDRQTLRLCWDVILMSSSRGEMFRTLIDLRSGEVLLRRCFTSYLTDASYRVFTSDSPSPFSPGYSTLVSTQPLVVERTLVTLPAMDTDASPAGWINDGDNETLGNNVDAHTDRNSGDLPDLPRPQGSPFRVFDFTMDLTTQDPTNYTSAAVVQLFYWNNWMHDKLYQLGFTEAAGNFQSQNFARGGLGDDPVMAEAQDGSGFNNANFSTPPDGSPGRMQMYIFNQMSPRRDGDLDAEIVLHEYTHGLSWRLVGGGQGLGTLQSDGMGEGWSDFYGLALLSQLGDDVNGNYAAGAYASYMIGGAADLENYYFGIRRYPYTTDLSRNPLTFKDIDPAQATYCASGAPYHNAMFGTCSAAVANEVHNSGEVWCVTLWEARANLINKYGWAVGNQLVLQLVTDGMKLSPMRPNFLQARDAIIQADLVDTSGANQSELWAAFAKRGMGFSAISPASSTTAGVVEAYDLPDDLRVSPFTGFSTYGQVGGPFTPACRTYVLTNAGSNTLIWTATSTESWVTVSSGGGSLTAGGSNSVNVCLSPTAHTLPVGTYTATIVFSNMNNGEGSTRHVVLDVTPPPVWVFTLDSDPGWSRQGEWAFGRPAGLGGDFYGNPDPSSGANGNNVFGINLNGNYSLTVGGPYYLAAGPFDFSGYAGVRLQFQRWLNCDSDPYTSATVEVSANESAWTTIWNNGSAETADAAWTRVCYDISALADGQTNVYVRWGHRVGLLTARPCSGWNVDDIQLLGTPTRSLNILLPGSVSETAGALANAGILRLATALPTNLVVSLVSSVPSRLTVPATTTIPAGLLSNSFNVTAIDNSIHDGDQLATITASALGFTAVSSAMLIVDDETPPSFLEQPTNLTTFVSYPALFSVNVTGRPPFSYQWRKGGIPIADATTSRYAIAGAQTTDADVYSVIVTNIFGSATSADAILTVLTNSVLVPYFTDNNPALTGPEQPIIQAGFVPFHVTDIATLNLPSYGMLCINEYNNLSVSAALAARLADIQDWVAHGGKLIVHDRSAGNLDPNPLLLGAPGALTVRFVTSDLDVVPPGNSLVVAGPFGMINDTTLDGGDSSAHGYVAENQLPPDAIPFLSVGGAPDNVVCFSYPLGEGTVYYSAIPLDYYLAGSAGSNNPIAVPLQTIYTPNLLTYASRSASCTNCPPEIIAQPANQLVAVGAMASFSVWASGTPPLVYEWRKNGVPIGGAAASSFAINKVQFSDAGSQFSCRVSNACGAVTSSVAVLSVFGSLYCFSGFDGGYPNAGLIHAADGNFYGTTQYGGTYGDGTVFRITTNGVATTLISFDSTGGGYSPAAGLVQGTDGSLYGTTTSGGAFGCGTVFRLTTEGDLATMASFSYAGGYSPSAELVQGADGNLYGTLSWGGTYGYGAVFRVTTNGVLTTLASFNSTNGASPSGGLIQAADGNLYGTTASGGYDSDYGTVFKITTDGALTTLYSFDDSNTDGSYPCGSLVQDSDGNLYGTAGSGGIHYGGTVFRITTNGVLTTLASLDYASGNGPQAGLARGADGHFYGTTAYGGVYGMGTVYRVTREGVLTNLISFAGTNGSSARGALVQAVGRSLYGTTLNGGLGFNGEWSSGDGTVFCIAAAPVAEALAISTQPSSRTVALGGSAMFSIAASSALPLNYLWQRDGVAIAGATQASYTITDVQLADSASRFSCLVGNGLESAISSNAVLTIVPIGASGSLFAFSGYDGGYPSAGLVQAADGCIYGTTAYGGTDGDGTVFRMTANGVVTTVLSFNSETGGYHPMAGLTQGANGNLYGTTASGGTCGNGTVFRLTTNGVIATLASFGYADGYNPYGSLVQDDDGNLYGTLSGGGTYGYGAVFRVTTNGVLTSLASFNSTNGASPSSGLVQAADGSLYGTTESGGRNSYYGTVFNITIDGALTTLYSFGDSNTNGYGPHGSLMQDSDGNFYGTTGSGGMYYSGTVFRITTNGVLTTLASFDYANGAFPQAGLMRGADGSFYGTTAYGGVYGMGTVYRMTREGVLTNLFSFAGTNGSNARGALVQAGDGSLYGTTLNGGLGFTGAMSSGDGTVFRVAVAGSGPFIIAQPASQTVRVGGTVSFSTIASGAPPLSYQWRKDGVDIAGASASSFSLGPVQIADAAVYSVEVTNAYGSILSSNALLTLFMANDICSGATPISGLNYTYSQSTVEATSTGDPIPSCGPGFGSGVWYKYTPMTNGKMIVDTIGSDFDTVLALYGGSCDGLSQVACDDDSGGGVTSRISTVVVAGTPYFVLAGGYGGESGNLVLHMELTPSGTPPLIVTQPVSQTNPVGTSATFSVGVAGSLPFGYQWRFNRTNDIANATNATLTLFPVTLGSAGGYSVIVTNPYGAATSAMGNLTVVLPTPPAILIRPPVLISNQLLLGFLTVTGHSYVVEYKNALSDGTWLPLITNTADGTDQTVTNIITASPTRFFRVRIE